MPVVPFTARPGGEPAPQVDQNFMDMAGAELHKAGFFDNLFNRNPPTDMTNAKAPQLSTYPTDQDAKVAIENEFGYGKGNEDYIKGEHAQVLGMTDKKGKFTPLSRFDVKELEMFKGETDSNVDMTKFQNIDTLRKINTVLPRAALAVNRNPIAAMGFDPRRTILDIESGEATAGGSYANKSREGETLDRSWVNLPDSKTANASSVVHESIHRGIAKIRESREADTLLAQLGMAKEHGDMEEVVTRYMMYKYAGDPEGTLGKEDATQRKRAIDIIEKINPRIADRVDQLMELAANQLKNQRPGGPR